MRIPTLSEHTNWARLNWLPHPCLLPLLPSTSFGFGSIGGPPAVQIIAVYILFVPIGSFRLESLDNSEAPHFVFSEVYITVLFVGKLGRNSVRGGAYVGVLFVGKPQ